MGTRLDVGVIALGAELERWHPDYLASTAGTDFTELNPRPGTPTTTDNYPRLQPQIVGAQSQDVELLVMEAGFPKQGGTGLQVGYYLSGESESVARGYQAPLFFVDKVMAVSTTGTQATAAACPLCGRIVVASGSNAARNVTVFNPYANGFTTPSSPTVISAAALAFVPGTERLLWIANGACYYSDDHGTTWTEYDDEGPTSVMTSFTVTSAFVGQDAYRAAFDGAGNLLYAAYNENGTASIDLAASSDQGASWSLVESIAEVTALRYDMCAMTDGAIAFVYNDTGTDNKVRFKRLGGAFEAPSGVDAVEVTAAALGAGVGAIGIACDENGALWCYVTELTASTITHIYFSVDAGATWTKSSDLVTLSGGGYEIVQFALVPHPYGGLGGHMCSLGGFVRLGGWSGPGRDSGNWTDQTAPRADMHWFGTDDPANFGMTKTGASTDAIVNSGGTSPHGYWRVLSGAGAAQGYWQRTVHSANRSEAAAEWLCRITDDGGTTSSAPSASGIGVRLQSADAGANQRRTIIVYMDEGGYRVWDEEAAAWIGSKVSATLTTRTFFRVSFTSTAIHVMHRQDATSKTKWTLTTLAAPSTAATGASGVIARWGHLTGVANTESHWWIVYARGVSASPMEGTSNDGVGLGPYSYPLPDLHDSTNERLSRLTLRGGPAFTGDTYTVTADHDYPVEALFPQAEPNMERVWQSAASPTTETIVCSLHDSQDTLPNSTSIVLAVRNCNVRQISLMAQTKAGASTSMATLDLATGFTSIAWIRSGNVVAPNAAYTSGRFIGAGELRGGHFYDAGSGLAREIEDNTAGFWSTAASVKATIFLKGNPSSLGAFGTGGFIAWPAGVLILHMSPTVTKRGNWGIRIATQPFDSTQDTGYRCKASLLAVRVPGKSFDRGVEWSLRPNVRSEADERGTDRRERKGPMRRMLTIPWDHGADMQGFRGTRGDATEYVGPDGSGGPALAVRDDVWQQLTGLYTASGDGSRLVCAILKTAPDWNSGTSQSTETITDPTAYIVGYLDSDLRATLNRGAFGTEFVMPGPLRIVEAV
jgi:hypothetical protein